MRVIYISGPYTAYEGHTVEQNIAHAREVAVDLIKRGYAPICPHLNTQGMENDGIPYDAFMMMDLEHVRRADAVLMLKGWGKSHGARLEHERARLLNMEIMYEEEWNALQD